MVVPFVIRAVAGREPFLEYLLARLPGAIVALDTTRNALDTFVTACGIAGGGAAFHLEDDVILTRGFRDRVAAAVALRPASVIQFFSRRGADLTVGSREEPGRTFLMGQCFYLPPGMSRGLANYAAAWPRQREHPTGLDMMVADYLRQQGLTYWLHVPSLVQHRQCPSIISPRRSRSRQSLTFIDPDE